MEEDEGGENWWDILWSVTLFGTLVVVFFPWSLLVMLWLYGWDGTIIILKEMLNVAWAIVVWLIILAIIIFVILMYLASNPI